MLAVFETLNEPVKIVLYRHSGGACMLIFIKKLFDKETKMSLIELNNLFTELKAEELFEINGGRCFICRACGLCGFQWPGGGGGGGGGSVSPGC